MIQFLIDNGADVDAESYYNTPLCIAAERGYLKNVQMLVENGADVNLQNEEGELPLTLAAAGDHDDVARFLVENGADVNMKEDNDDRLTSLIIAVAHDDLNLAKFFVDNGADVNKSGTNHNTAIFYVRSIPMLDYLMSKGANINEVNGHGETPLLYNVHNGNVQLLEKMIDHGANVYHRADDSENLLAYAMQYENLRLIDFLFMNDIGDALIEDAINYIMRYKAQIPYVLYYIAKDKQDLLRLIIHYINDEHLVNKFISQAVKYNDLDAVIFIENNFDITFNTVLDENRNTLLSTAGRYSSVEVTRFIYEKVKNELHDDYIQILKYFIRQNKEGLIALELAYKYCNRQSFIYLYNVLKDEYGKAIKDKYTVKLLSIEPCRNLTTFYASTLLQYSK